MHLNHTQPTTDQMKALKAYPSGEPLVMVNILRFLDKTSTGESGAEMYQRYVKNVYPLIKKAGGRLVWRGEVQQTVIGGEENQAQLIMLVEYPSVDHFISMATSEEYQKISQDRHLSLEYGGLLACRSL